MKYGSTVLFVDDVPKVMAFYEAAFGFTKKFYDPDFGFGDMDAGGMSLAFGTDACGERMMPGKYRPPSSGNPEGLEIAFFLEDVAAAYDRAVTAGAEPVAEPKEMPWGQTVAYVRSIEGTIIGLCTPLPEPTKNEDG